MATVTRLKRQLGAALQELRDRAGKSVAEVAEELKLAETTLNRHEAGETLPNWPTVLTQLEMYGADAATKRSVDRMWKEANEEAPPVRLPAGASKPYRRYLTAEREAVRQRGLEMLVVPGLLQTGPYARAIQNSATPYLRPGGRTEGYVNVRLTRQERLEEPNPLKFHAVIDEAVLHRLVGGREVLHEQLARLLVFAEWPNITIQVVRFEIGAYGLMSGSVAILDYAEPDSSPGVYLEYPAGGAWVENAEDVGTFTTMFEDAASAALTPAKTADLIHKRMRSM